MHDLVRETSRALSQQDSETLERLLREAGNQAALPGTTKMAELVLASMVLTAQVRAAERHLGVLPQQRVAGWNSPWEL